MTAIGNHIKTNVHKNLRDRVRTFYLDILQCKSMPAPMADLDLFVFDNDFVLGVFYYDERNLLTEAEHLNSAWLEIKAKDVLEVKGKLLSFGVKEVDYPDKTRFFFQAPGGQVFRLAPEDGGI
jgi:hypothetical protein